MKKIVYAFAMAALLLFALPVSSDAAAPEYPGQTIDGEWTSVQAARSFDVKAGKCIMTSIEGNKEEEVLAILSDDGETVVYTLDGAEYVAKKQADDTLSVAKKGREKFPLTMQRAK